MVLWGECHKDDYYGADSSFHDYQRNDDEPEEQHRAIGVCGLVVASVSNNTAGR